MGTDPSSVKEAELRAMFRRLGTHKDGKLANLPLDQFVEKHEAIKIFDQKSQCVQAINLALLEKVNEMRSTKVKKMRSTSEHGRGDLSATTI